MEIYAQATLFLNGGSLKITCLVPLKGVTGYVR